MKLVKIEDGLLEQENYFINTPIGDFLGDFLCSRTNGVFTLKEGFIERNFPYNEYVIIVEKEPVTLEYGDIFKIYTRKDDRISGILEYKDIEENSQANYWKLVRYDGFIQGYTSINGTDWANKGGGNISEPTDIQGFSIEGAKELKIKDYKVYSSPYIRIYNLPNGSRALLKDEAGNLILERVVDEDGLVEIYVENPLLGKIIVLDKDNQQIGQTDLLELKYGDVFFNTEHNIELYYKGEIVDYSGTRLGTKRELVVVKNASSIETYENIKLTLINNTVDEILISLDNINFYKELGISNLSPLDEKEVYIKIVKNINYQSYGIRKFAIEIDSY